MNIAIFGAAGAIGPAAALELSARGHRVRAVSRNRAALEVACPVAQPFVADLADPEAARAAAAGMDAILYAVGVPYNRFDLHPPMMRATLAAAKAENVKLLVHVSNVYPYGRPQTTLVAETHPRDPHTRKGRLRKIQEDLVLEADDAAALRTLVLRLPDFYGPSAANSVCGYALDSIAKGRPADLLGPIDTPHEWVFVPDVAPVVADLFARPHAFGTSYNLAGPGVMSEREFAAKLFAAAGRPLRYRESSPMLLRALGVFNPTMRELVEMGYLHETPVILDDSKLHGVLGAIVKTSYDDGIAATVAARFPGSVAA
jgi:nucleoside-diphosphate-sugar epimerase